MREEKRAPAPFSSEWIMSPPDPAERRVPSLPTWFPSDHGLTAALVIVLTLLVVFGGAFGGRAAPGVQDSGDPAPRIAAVSSPEATATVAVPTPTASPIIAPPVIPTAAPVEVSPTLVAGLNLTPPSSNIEVTDPRALLPRYRILSYYGHPNDPNMGVLGEQGMDESLQKLREQQAAYEAADPTRPIQPAFELIASVAQNWPADDDTWLLHTGAGIIDQYAQFAEQNGLILILDIQIGHSNVTDEIERVMPWLELPYVHLAIDPEFSMAPGEVPGQSIGSLDASAITEAQNTLAKLVKEKDLPPKLLIVHQFEENMIMNADTLTQVDGVQLVIEFDGFGEPSNKIAGYNLFITDRHLPFGGIKLFYKQDSPLLTPQEVLALTPSPDLIIYQ
jgi:hypothetical protein